MKEKYQHKVLGLAVAVLCAVLAGCSGESSKPADALETVSRITITGDDRMRFAPTRFAVKASEEVTLTLHNIGVMPVEAMGHNLAILDKGIDANVFAAASIRYPHLAYIAPQYAARVIAATAVLGPGEKEDITFTAPGEPGEYPFVCSFPGHTPAGMKGVMVVLE